MTYNFSQVLRERSRYVKKAFIVFFLCCVGMSVSASKAKAFDLFEQMHFALKVDSINFTDSYLEDLGADHAVYYGFEGYLKIYPNLFLGGEAGYAHPQGSEGDERIDAHFYSVELNMKYNLELLRELSIDFGAGPSAFYVSDDIDDNGGIDRFLGWQVFIDLNYYGEDVEDYGKFFVGIHGKYQQAQEKVDWDWDYSNWRVGAHMGFMLD